MEESVIGIWCGKEIKEKSIKMKEEETDGMVLYIGSCIRIILSNSILEMGIEHNCLSVEQRENSFKIHFDKLYIFKKIEPYTRIYGIIGLPLVLSVKKSGWRVPNFVYRSIQCLRKHDAIHTQGLFRLTCSIGELKPLKEIIDLDKDIGSNFSDDCIVIGTLLKSCLKLMIEPVIPFNKAIEFSQLKQNSNPKQFINSLPIPNQDTLFILLQFLQEICSNQQENMMTFQNMSICFALCVCRLPEINSKDEISFTIDCISSFEFVLTNFDSLFEDIKERNEALGMEFPKEPAFSYEPHIDYGTFYSKNKLISKTKRNSKRLSGHYIQIAHGMRSISPALLEKRLSEGKTESIGNNDNQFILVHRSKSPLPKINISPSEQPPKPTPELLQENESKKKETFRRRIKRHSIELFSGIIKKEEN
ncbi:RhoGAP domain containing protein [Entamoeba histolytica HM-3:IMSS]|uniref:RhoGAP domain containing protein n=2 Tax=Entamoeba histolytica TaxID=5759 RepID=M7WTC9_ENTHI|nr:RhoGAP domain containing protein [Entamoeba histolytica HM-3:IMSS]